MHSLDEGARAIAREDRSARVDLSPLLSLFQREGARAVLAMLAQRVERYSDGSVTVRSADPALFAEHGGMGLSLVRCPIDTPEGRVTELGDGMTLVHFKPYSNGLMVGALLATPEEIASYRAAKAR